MLTYIIAHFVSGLLLGTFLRFGALFPAFAVVILEAVFAAYFAILAPWYLLVLAGICALQLGYACASQVKAHFGHGAHRAAHPTLSTRNSWRA